VHGIDTYNKGVAGRWERLMASRERGEVVGG